MVFYSKIQRKEGKYCERKDYRGIEDLPIITIITEKGGSMCLRKNRKGDVVCQGCNYGEIIGEVKFLNKEPEPLYACSNCGKIMKYDEFLGELFKDWSRRENSFEFKPSELFWGKRLGELCVYLGRQGIIPSITFVPDGIPAPKRKIGERRALNPA